MYFWLHQCRFLTAQIYLELQFCVELYSKKPCRPIGRVRPTHHGFALAVYIQVVYIRVYKRQLDL